MACQIKNAESLPQVQIALLEYQAGAEVMPEIGEIRTGKNWQKQIWHACENCGQERWVELRNGVPRKLICVSCRCKAHGEIARQQMLNKKGELNYSWKGGKRINCHGYNTVRLMEDDPFYPMTVNGYVIEHRLIMAKHVGRCLTDEEVVHHINENKLDNWIENLMLFPSNREHINYHYILQNNGESEKWRMRTY